MEPPFQAPSSYRKAPLSRAMPLRGLLRRLTSLLLLSLRPGLAAMPSEVRSFPHIEDPQRVISTMPLRVSVFHLPTTISGLATAAIARAISTMLIANHVLVPAVRCCDRIGLRNPADFAQKDLDV